MPSYNANVQIAVGGTAVRLYTPGAVPGIFIAHGGTLQSNPTNAAPLNVGLSTVTAPGTIPAIYMFQLFPGDSVPFPNDAPTDISSLWINGSANDGVSLGWFN